MNQEKLLDAKSWQLLRELQEDARLTYAELARRVGLSVPSVVERVRKLEDAGIISGYHARVNVKALGLPLSAVVRLSAQGRHLRQVAELVQELPEVLQCYRVTGDACYLLIVAAADMEHLERLLDRLSFYGQTNTSMVVSTPLDRRVVTGTVRETPPKT